jgi:hypothetical protein
MTDGRPGLREPLDVRLVESDAVTECHLRAEEAEAVDVLNRRNRRGRRRLFAGQPRRVAAMVSSDPNVFSSEYRPFTIIPPVSRPQRLAPLIIAGGLIVLGAALISVFAR